jgi:hypothetical protein
MIRTLTMQARILTGLLTIVGCALPQAYTISAKPGAVSYIEGNVSVNGAPVSSSDLRSLFLAANDRLFTEAGKAEVLLAPGVFLRVGDNSQVRMISPSLVEPQVELVSGEAMIELDQFVAGSSTSVLDHGSLTVLQKTGLYRFTADAVPTAAVLEGKADVNFGGKRIELGKNKQALLTDELTASKLDLNKTDDLYAWSNVRAQYDAAVSYQGAKSAYNSGGYGYSSGYQTPGLYWNGPYSSWMWMPGDGAFYSPFGWGFYGPGLVAYAPIVGYGYGYAGGYLPIVGKAPVAVPINPKHPGVVAQVATSPALHAAMRQQVANNLERTGYQFHTLSGRPAAYLPSGRTFSSPQAAARAASASAASRQSSGGEWSGGGASAASSSTASARSSVSSGVGMSSGGGRAMSGSSGGGSSRSK